MDYDPASSTLYMYLTDTHSRPDEFTQREHRMFYAVNDLARSAGTLSELMDAVYNASCEVCPTDRMSFLMLEESGTRVVSHWVRTRYASAQLTGGYQEDLKGSSLAALLESGQPRVINDLELYLAEHPDSRATKLLVAEGVRSSLAYPLQVDNQAVGILVRNSKDPWSFGYHQIRVHEVLVRILSQAVRRAFQYEQVDAANRAYLEVLGFVSHEMKSPLASMVMDARLLTEGYIGALEPKQVERVQKIISKADYLLSLIREYLDLARIEGGELALHPHTGVDFVGEVLEQAIDLARGHIEQREMKIVRMLPRTPVRIDCDPDLLRIALFNLVGNAAKYGKQGGNIRVGLVVQPASFEVSVFNDGPGFPPDEKPKLFRKFSRLQTPELRKQKGTGVGLYTVWRIAQLHGGRTWAESQPGQWAEFGFAIPQPLACPLPNKDG
jgi:signal transduction histidine kinase